MKAHFSFFHTVHHFSAFQILREIKISKSGGTKIAILTHLEALKSNFCDVLHLGKVKMDQISKFRVSKLHKMAFLDLLGWQKLISRKI